MVFSQTSQKTRSILKVVDLNHLKQEKNQQVNGSTGVVTLVDSQPGPPSSPATVTTSSSMEEFLKTEPEDYESTMYQILDSEFYQDLGLWCSAPAKEEQALTIDSFKISDEKANNTDTLHTQLSPRGRDGFDANSPIGPSSFYNTTPIDPLSPIDGFLQFENKFLYPDLGANEKKNEFQEQFMDITTLPVVIGDLASVATGPQTTSEPSYWTNIHNTDYTTNTPHKNPFIDQEDSMDLKLPSVVPKEVEWNDVVISEYVIDGQGDTEAVNALKKPTTLTLDIESRAPAWCSNFEISTPEVLSYVEQLEKEKQPSLLSDLNEWPVPEETSYISLEESRTNSPSAVEWGTPEETTFITVEDSKNNSPAAVIDYEPITPKTESHIESEEDVISHKSRKRRRDSGDSDESYTPCKERSSPKKYRRRKPSVPIKEMILALEESQPLTKAKRGRPPKRRDSTVSSVCSVDNGSSVSTQEYKYREIRDKNNEASKRSRMNRKLKELQMEQMALDLEERNKKLQVKADILEEMTKKLKDALMKAILKQ